MFIVTYHTLGNKFVIVDTVRNNNNFNLTTIKEIITIQNFDFDQLLLIQHTKIKNCDFHYRIFNVDGSEVIQCINGTKAVADYALKFNLTTKKKLKLHNNSGNIFTVVHKYDNYYATIIKNIISLMPKDIPLNKNFAKTYSSKILNTSIEYFAVSIGNPHAIIKTETEEFNSYQQEEIATLLSSHHDFPLGTNVSFFNINKNIIKLKTFERGVGFTAACGSAAVATAFCCIHYNLTKGHKIIVDMRQGQALVEYEKDMFSIYSDTEFIEQIEVI